MTLMSMILPSAFGNWDAAAWFMLAKSQLPEYFYVPCEGNVAPGKEQFKSYFRLYRKLKTGVELVAQDVTPGNWEEKYGAKFITDESLKPYPFLD